MDAQPALALALRFANRCGMEVPCVDDACCFMPNKVHQTGRAFDDNLTTPLRDGLTWAGNLKYSRLLKRRIPFRTVLPLLMVEGVEFFSLQIEGGAEELRQSPGAARMIDHTQDIRDFADTAALLMELDLIISVDTAVAHLAGALGRPVWTLLPFVPDWRWGLEGERTPWYPTMRLFRQPAIGDWASVIQRVAGELQRLLNLTTPA